MSSIVSLDSGGSKTECAVISDDGELLAYQIGTGGREYSLSENMHGSIIKLTLDTLKKSGSKDNDVIAFNAVLMHREKEAFLQEMRERFKYAQTSRLVENDNNFHCATLKENGILFHSGTGSFVAHISQNNPPLVYGGFGNILGDEGSGYYLGKELIRACIYAVDGRGEDTILVKHLKETLKIETDDFFDLAWIFNRMALKNDIKSVYAVSSLSKILKIGCDLNDKVSLNILENASYQLALQFEVLINKMVKKNEKFFSFSGGVFYNWKMYRDLVAHKIYKIDKNIKCVEPCFQPILGGFIKHKGLEWSNYNKDKLFKLQQQINSLKNI